MCSFVDRLLMVCGPTPTIEYVVLAAALGALVVFLVRP